MTVVSAMKLRDNRGAIVADEQSSNMVRKYDIAEKIHCLEKGDAVLLYGGSGGADFLYEVHKAFQRDVPEEKAIQCIRHMAVALGSIMIQTKMQFIDGHLTANYDLTLGDLKRGYTISRDGKSEIDPSIKQAAWNSLEKGEAVGFSGFLVLGKDKNGVEIYNIETSNSKPQLCARPYSCIGSGRDMADGELAAYIDSLPRDQRDNIDPVQGLAHLLYATDRASRMNMGVGGTPSIMVLDESGVLVPSESNSRLAGEIVRASRAGLLPDAFVNNAVRRLIFCSADFQTVNRHMWEATTDKEGLDYLLRDYRPIAPVEDRPASENNAPGKTES